MKNKIIQGDCLEVMKTLETNSIDTIITDPPYGISFMGKKWDYDVPSVEVWQECLRVLKPGGHALVACGTRTQHRMAVNIEDAGFEIRDLIAWVYGSGFPKSLNIGKAVDKIQGNEREDLGEYVTPDGGKRDLEKHKPHKEARVADHKYGYTTSGFIKQTKGNSPYEGCGTALKPAMELWTLARKPFKGTVAENVLKYGTGGLNIDGCRVEIPKDDKGGFRKGDYTLGSEKGYTEATSYKPMKDGTKYRKDQHSQGRFPANLIHDGSKEVVEKFPDGHARGNKKQEKNHLLGDSGSASRFFYCAKASKSERGKENNHPTVKPLKLMEYLCTLTATPTKGIVLDPFAGSGTTCIASQKTGRDYIGIEISPEYCKIAKERLSKIQGTLL